MKNWVIFGGKGFICGEVVRQLLLRDDVQSIIVVDNNSKHKTKNELPYNPDDHRLVFYDFDMTSVNSDHDNWCKLINKCVRADYLVFGCAKIGGISYFNKYPWDIISQNNDMLRNALEASAGTKGRFIYISSSMVFESTDEFPSTEESLTRIPIPLSSYGFSKLSGEFYVDAFDRQYGIDYVIVRPFNAAGRGEWPQKEVGMAHCTNDLIRKIHLGQGTEDNPLEILGDGSQIRHYTIVSDVASGIIVAAEKGKKRESYNISSPTAHAVYELAQLIWERMGKTGKLYKKHLPGLDFDVQKRIPSVEKAKVELGWTAQYVIEDKLDEIIEWTRKVVDQEEEV